MQWCLGNCSGCLATCRGHCGTNARCCGGCHNDLSLCSTCCGVRCRCRCRCRRLNWRWRWRWRRCSCSCHCCRPWCGARCRCGYHGWCTRYRCHNHRCGRRSSWHCHHGTWHRHVGVRKSTVVEFVALDESAHIGKALVAFALQRIVTSWHRWQGFQHGHALKVSGTHLKSSQVRQLVAIAALQEIKRRTVFI